MTKASEVDLICLAVGRALHNWSRVENAIVAILARFMETRTSSPAAAVWGNVVSLGPKLKIVDEVMPRYLGDAEARKLWSGLSDKVSKASRLRNRLAHFEIVKYDQGYRLVNGYLPGNMGSLDHADTTPDTAMDRLRELYTVKGHTSAEVQQFADSFRDLYLSLRWFLSWVIDLKRIPRELDTDPPQLIADLLAKIPSK